MRGRPIARTLAAALGAVGILGLVSLPPEHVHLIAEHGEHTELVHRHLAPHHYTGASSNIDHDDGDAEYLDSSFTIPAPTQLTAPVSAVLARTVLLVPASQRAPITIPIDERVHDPPSRTSASPRAPPARLT